MPHTKENIKIQEHIIKKLENLLIYFPTLTFKLFADNLLGDFILEISCNHIYQLSEEFHEEVVKLDAYLEEYGVSFIISCEGEWDSYQTELIWQGAGIWSDKTYTKWNELPIYSIPLKTLWKYPEEKQLELSSHFKEKVVSSRSEFVSEQNSKELIVAA